MRRRIADSITAQRTAVYDSALATRAADSVRTGAPPLVRSTTTIGGVTVTRMMPSSPPPLPAQVFYEDIPDYMPPSNVSPKADADGNVWLSPITDDPGVRIWEVHNRVSGLIDRVSVPSGRIITAFAPGGIVYVTARHGDSFKIERVHLR
jgi:hypothetical protein